MNSTFGVVLFLLLTMSASSLSAPVKPNSRQLIRDIQACNSNVSQALDLLKETNEEGPYLAGLHVCGKAKRHDIAIDLYRKFPTSESCRALAISVCGRCGEYKQALKLLNGEPKNISIQSYNAAIAACGHSHAWKEALSVLQSMPTNLVSSFTCNAVLTALSKSKRGTEAYDLLKAMKSRRDPAKRGGHIAVEHDNATRIFTALGKRGVIGDLRPPNVIRLAPSPLYNTFTEIWDVVDRLKSAVEESGD